jgi:hypothetical protein
MFIGFHTLIRVYGDYKIKLLFIIIYFKNIY